ncbi:ap-4 complex subunit mu [Quercus suber]|uniref:Ap-4 complex subunit mu n=1 Tax=Quercus suber TaxID=58331 RepID=A0AAW0L3A8_QUESU
MISQFFVLSQRGDNIVFRDYRGEIQKGSTEIFFRKVKFWKEDGQEEAPPVFVGIILLKNDFGYVQTTSTEMLKSYVFNEPIVVEDARLQYSALFMQGTKRMPGTAVTKSVVANDPTGRRREEIFVDLIEKISITFSSSVRTFTLILGYILTSEIDGTIQMKSYLTGNPEIRLALNDDLTIGRGGRSVFDYRSSSGTGAVILDDCNFHESVHLDSFEMDKTLSLVPPDGEFTVMNYRLTQEFKPPFRVNTLIEETGALKVPPDGEFTVMNYRLTQEFKPPFRVNTLIEETGALKAEVMIKVRAEFSSSITANTIMVQMPLPKYTTSRNLSINHIVGGSEHTLRAKLTFSPESHGNITKESGPVSMTFTIPMYNASRLQVKYLQIAKKSGTYNPYRWVRYVTQANSYVARI